MPLQTPSGERPAKRGFAERSRSLRDADGRRAGTGIGGIALEIEGFGDAPVSVSWAHCCCDGVFPCRCRPVIATVPAAAVGKPRESRGRDCAGTEHAGLDENGRPVGEADEGARSRRAHVERAPMSLRVMYCTFHAARQCGREWTNDRKRRKWTRCCRQILARALMGNRQSSVTC